MNTSRTPREAVTAVLDHPTIPTGVDERFVGYGIMGLPFASGHYLALRDFPATTFAPGYRSVWHRDPAGLWTFYATTPGPQSCSRYFSSATPNDAVERDITVEWLSGWSMLVSMPGLLDWQIDMTATAATGFMSRMGRWLPEWAWTSPGILGAMSRAAGPLLGVGQVRLAGTAPNGQRYMVAPKQIWAVTRSQATLRGEDLGPIGPLHPQACLGDFRLPQKGICVVGSGHFENFDVHRHVLPGQSGHGLATGA